MVLAIHALLLFALLRLAPSQPPSKGTALRPLTVELLPDTATAPKQSPAPPEREAPPPSGATEARPPMPAPLPPPMPQPAPSEAWSKVLPMTNQELAAADLSRFPSPPAPTAGGNASGDEQADAGAFSPERLYRAEWQRRPTSTELGGYLPANRPRTGWGMIACRTVENFRVEDCREIGQSPAGSGFARAVREAAWQFRVIPPRIGGRSLVGAWVSIRIEYTEGEIRAR